MYVGVASKVVDEQGVNCHFKMVFNNNTHKLLNKLSVHISIIAVQMFKFAKNLEIIIKAKHGLDKTQITVLEILS